MHSSIAPLLAEYIEHVVVEFSDGDNHTKHAMTLLLIACAIDMDNMHHHIYIYIWVIIVGEK